MQPAPTLDKYPLVLEGGIDRFDDLGIEIISS